MKKLFILLFVVLSFNCFAQKEVIDQVGNAAQKVSTTIGNAIDSGKQAVKEGVHLIDTSSNFKRIYGDMKEGIAALASSLKVGAEHVYKVLVKQQIVIAIANLVWILFLILLVVVFSKNISQAIKDGNDDELNAPGVKCIISGALSFILFLGIAVTGMIPEMIMGFVNPEYGAIKDIIDIVHGAK